LGISGGGPTALACAACQGQRDTLPSPVHGRWLAGRIPGVDAHFPEDDDHSTIEASHAAEA